MDRRRPELLLIICEGVTEAEYFRIIKRQFRLPTWIKIMPDQDECRTPGQHERLVDVAVEKKALLTRELNVEPDEICVWVVCDRDNYKDSFTKLRQYAESKNIELGFSDPQFESYLLQHFSANKSSNSGHKLISELSEKIGSGLYKKTDLSWLEEMIDCKHSIVRTAIANAGNFTNHTKQPFFTVQNLVSFMLRFERK